MDSQSFQELVGPHLPGMVAYARSLCGDAALAEDVVQDSALIAWRNVHLLFPEADFRTWLKAIVRRQALAAGRRSRRLDPLVQEQFEAVFEIEDDVLDEERSALRRCVAALPERLSEVVSAYYTRGESINGISDLLATKPATVKTLLHRARSLLRECIDRNLRVAPR